MLSEAPGALCDDKRQILTWFVSSFALQVVGGPLPSTDERRRAIEEALRLSGDALFVGRNNNDIMVEVSALAPLSCRIVMQNDIDRNVLQRARKANENCPQLFFRRFRLLRQKKQNYSSSGNYGVQKSVGRCAPFTTVFLQKRMRLASLRACTTTTVLAGL